MYHGYWYILCASCVVIVVIIIHALALLLDTYASFNKTTFSIVAR